MGERRNMSLETWYTISTYHEEAMREMENRAKSIGANAIVGIDLDYEVLGETGSMMMVTASGTAVVID